MNQFHGNRRFESLECLGRGWNGSVHKVLDRETGAVLAAKVLDVQDPERIYRLKREFRALARLRHPNLVELYELVVNSDECFFTMELIEGGDFLDYIRGPSRTGDPNGILDRFRRATRQLATGLHTLHASGVIHRDLKPANVLVDREGRVVLLDFGLSAALGARDSGEVVGTAGYMAPEQLWGLEVGAPADWYAVGVMLYEALSGRLPFPPGANQNELPPPVRTGAEWIPGEVEQAISALLHFDAGARLDGNDFLSRIGIDGERGASTSPPSGRGLPFVGRTMEHERLQRAFDDVGFGAPVVVHVHGPSGIGKTELVRRFLDEVEGELGALVLRGRCHAQETVPYNAFDGLMDALSGSLREDPALAAASHAAGAAALLRLFPVLARIPTLAELDDEETPAEPRELRRIAFASLRELLARVAASHRLVLWIDDAQWCDEDSRALATELLQAPDAPNLLLVLTHRPEDRERVPLAAGEDTGSLARVEISLGPLAVEESRELARLLSAGHSVNADAVASQAAGSPFFVAALVRQRVGAGGSLDDAAPADLTEVLRTRVEELTAPEQRLLEVVSVAGQPLERAVALEASSIGQRSWTLLINLEKDNLLRTVKVREQEGIEIYHDRIRQALLATLSAGQMKECHRHLAESLSARPDPEPRALFRHYVGAEELGPAARWGVEAADRADRALAFADAAEIYGQVIPLVEEGGKRELTLKRASALVNAGRGAEAAPIFLEAAPGAAAQDRLDLRRRAAEQFLVSGHLDRGVEVVRELLGEFGVSYPQTHLGAIAGTSRRLLGIAIRGAAEPRRARRRSNRLRGDACNAAFKGLVVVDPVRALYFGVRSLSLSLGGADRFSIARDLTMTGGALVPLGGVIGRWGGRMLHRGRRIATELQDPYLLGVTSVTMAQESMMEGRWREMLERCDSGVDLLQRRCRGVTWERDIGQMAAARALEELGDFMEIDRRMELWQRDAEGASNVYGVVEALVYRGLCRLATNDVSDARAMAKQVFDLWTARGFHMQHFYAFRIECYCDLYDGRPLDAWDRIARTWPLLRKSNLLRHTLMRGDAYLLRARVALALAANRQDQREPMLEEARQDANRLEQDGRMVSSANANLIRAACLTHAARNADAVAILDRAAKTYRAAEMQLCEAYASFRASQLADDELRPARSAFATSVFQAKGIADPDRLLAAYAPGFAALKP